MTKGKIAAQCSHATLACFKALQRANPNLLGAWERYGQAKIALKAEGDEELLLLEAQAKSLGVCARSIQDACVSMHIQVRVWMALMCFNAADEPRSPPDPQRCSASDRRPNPS